VKLAARKEHLDILRRKTKRVIFCVRLLDAPGDTIKGEVWH